MNPRFLIPLFLASILTFPALPGNAVPDPLAMPEIGRHEVICFALYTTQGGTLKLTAQLYPLLDEESREVRLECWRDGAWTETARTTVITPGWTAPFRVTPWDDTRTVRYRVRHGDEAEYEGTIRANPTDREEIVVAAFTGNSVYHQHGGDLPRDDLLRNIEHIDPDLLFFSGDQVYDHTRHYEGWLKFGRDFGPIIRNRPTVTIPDDHDVGQANLWGAGGKKASTPAGDDGGYFAPAEYVREVERAQTSHLPDPYDPRPIENGIGVYYTRLNVGGIDFAIIEDRKFKSGPAGLAPQQGPRPDHVSSPDYDPKALDVPEAKLLGERQLAFLRQWAADWRDADMKAVLSQTVFAGGAHIHGTPDNRLYADLDSNGWPQHGRDKALTEIRRARAFLISGDQHLGTFIQHGIGNWRDAGYSFCVPSIANLYLRWWKPLEEGKNRAPGMAPHLGDFHDGLGNKLTMLAVANPSPEPNKDKLTTRAAGFGVVRFNKTARTITAECWPRNVDVAEPGARPYPGWPITVRQEDNDGRAPVGWLPKVQAPPQARPVVRVIDEESGVLEYALRLRQTPWKPPVYRPGVYTVELESNGAVERYPGLTPHIPTEEPLTIGAP